MIVDWDLDETILSSIFNEQLLPKIEGNHT